MLPKFKINIPHSNTTSHFIGTEYEHEKSTLTSGPLAEAAKVAKDTFKNGLSEKLLDPKAAPTVSAQKVDLDKGFSLKP